VPTELVTFDAGQTLVELDLDFLTTRLGERGITTTAERLAEATGAAWKRYDVLVDSGAPHPWQAFMDELLAGAGVSEAGPVVEWLWREQPTKNLFRKPIADMIALARELAASGVRVAVLSNSEGRLAELLEEVGIADAFAAIIDSGREGVAKPDPRIFARTLERVGGDAASAIHIGDSWSADVEGALGAGWRAVWFRGHGTRTLPVGVAQASDAAQVRAALAAFRGARGKHAGDQR
jgi:HAD superfamily hydrolase (TIGR01549 family)